MNRLLVVCAVVLAGGWAVQAQSSGTVDQQVRDAEKLWSEGFLCKPESMERLLDDQFILVGENAQILDRTAIVNLVKPCGFATMSVEVTSIRQFGDVAILVGTQMFSQKGRPPLPPYRITHTYARKNGVWKLVHHQSTIVPPKGGSNIPKPAGESK